MPISENMHPGELPKELQKPSDTRCSCRYYAYRVTCVIDYNVKYFLNELLIDVKGRCALDVRSLLAH